MMSEHKRLSAAELDAIGKRASQATEGNWHSTLDDPYDRTYVLGAFNGVVTVIADIKGDEDADFITNAHKDVPALLAEVERLREKISLYESLAQENDYYDILAEMDEEDAE